MLSRILRDLRPCDCVRVTLDKFIRMEGWRQSNERTPRRVAFAAALAFAFGLVGLGPT